MTSFDVNNKTVANITAQVTDIMGNPVSNQTVTFNLGTPSYDKSTDVITSAPTLTSTSAVTDNNGNAIVQFIPGGFTTNSSNVDYNPSATGNCSVTACGMARSKASFLHGKTIPIPVPLRASPHQLSRSTERLT